jgi:hypothetical protein
MNKFGLFSAVAAVAIVAPTAAYAQETTSTIRGEVTQGGAPVNGAQVVVTHVPSGTQSTTTSSADGSFSVSGLRVGGPFTIAVTAPGGETNQITDIFLQAGQPLRLPVELAAVGENAEAIVVTGVRGARQTSNGPITALNREDIEGVASVNRDIRDLARRDPFVTMDLANSRTIEVAGNNGRLNRFSVDGVQFSDDFGLNNGGLPTSRGPVPFDAIEQFAVRVAPFDISEGDFQGGAINVVLRSGTNQFRGSGFFTHSDDSLTGDRIDGQDISLDFRSQQYGGLIAGPILRDRLFFMFAYEHTSETDPFDDGVGPGFANQVPGITTAQIDQVNSVAQSVFGYDTLGLIQNADERDDKYIAKFDANLSDDHRASLTLVRNVGTQQFQQNTFTNAPAALGLQSNGYELGEEVNSGVLQLNSSWADNFSTEFRVSYRDTNRDQTPFGGREFAQFEVCLDPTSVNVPAQSNTLTSCGSTSRIFFGPDVSRQANDLNTDNLSVDLTGRWSWGSHDIKALIGYSETSVYNLFLQRALGDVYFDSLADFQNRRASRLRLGGAVPSLDVQDAAADFATQNVTLGIQDDWDISDTFQMTIGVRYDHFMSGDRPPLNPNFLQRHGFTNTATFDSEGAIQPRIGFNWQPMQRLIVRGGVGVFAGGTPDVFVSNSFSNTGQLTNAIDIQRNTSAAGCTPVPSGLTAAQALAFCNAALTNVTGRDFDPQVTTFLATNTASLAAAPVNAIDPNIDIASQLRATVSFNYEADFGALGDGWLFGVDLLYGNVLRAYQWTDLRSVQIGTLPDGRPRYGPFGGTATNNQDLLMTNETRGRSYIGVVRLSKEWDNGFAFDASYTRSDVKDTNAITSATAGSLYSNNAFSDPNRAAYGRSIYEIRDQFKLRLDYSRAFFGDYRTRFSLFGERRSGRPYSITGFDPTSGRGAVFGTVGNSARHLLYIPELNDSRVVFGSTTTGGQVTQTAEQAQTLFNQLVASNGLEQYRGQIVPKNSQRSPSVMRVDLQVSQELPAPGLNQILPRARFRAFADIENVLNMIDSDWGDLRQVSFPQTAALASVQCITAAGVANTNSGQTCAQYRYFNVQAPNENLVARQSLYQIRVGLRFDF